MRNITSDDYTVATVLDPRVKLAPCKANETGDTDEHIFDLVVYVYRHDYVESDLTIRITQPKSNF